MKKKEVEKNMEMTLNRNVKTLALKIYDEQLPNGWESLKKLIRSISKARYQILAIRHDRDTLGDDFFRPSVEKAHYHIIVRVMDGKSGQNVSKSGLHVRQILKDLHVVFRPEDVKMIEKHGIETVRNFAAYAMYLTHETPQAIADGKEHYEEDEIVSNLTPEEVKMIRDGYTRVSAQTSKLTLEDKAELMETATQLGYDLKDYDDWHDQLCARVHLDRTLNKVLGERYDRGLDRRLEEDPCRVARLCIYIRGNGNDGKTYTSDLVLRAMGMNKILVIDRQGSGKFDTLKAGTEAIIIDDQTAPAILNLCDNRVVKAYRRNSNDRPFTGKAIVVTSNLPFDEWAKQCGCSNSQLDAVRSRFFVCSIAKNDKGETILLCESASNRGTEAVLKERVKRYITFRDLFEEYVKGYIRPDTGRLFALVNDRSHSQISVQNEVAYLFSRKPPINQHPDTVIGDVVLPQQVVISCASEVEMSSTTIKQDGVQYSTQGDIVRLLAMSCPGIKAVEEHGKDTNEDVLWLKVPETDSIKAIIRQTLGDIPQSSVVYQ